MDHANVTTGLEIAGKKITKNLGLVRGITVRSRSVFGKIGARFQTIFGGQITLYTSLCEKSREEAYEMMMAHAEELGVNGVISVRYDANDVMPGVAEVLCYGTAVKVE